MSKLEPDAASLPGAERRQQPRIPFPPVRVHDMGAVIDISHEGICLELGTPEERGEPVRIEPGEEYGLILSDAHFCFTEELRAEVVWRAGSRAGMRWIAPSLNQSLWLKERFDQWLSQTLLGPAESRQALLRKS